eukprot:12821232-Alexandrium_andersonii.AAC.1
MSASLVGSEMCIRDSFEALFWAAQHARHFGPQAVTIHTDSQHALQAPVSYTHLTLPTICSV